MQTTDQVAGEAREKLADEFESHIRELMCGAEDLTAPEIFSFAQFAMDNREQILAALRAQPERGAEEMRERAAQQVEHIYATGSRWDGGTLAAAIRALPLHPAKDEGGGR